MRKLGQVSFPYLAAEGWEGELAFAGDADQPGGAEFLEVVRKGSGRDRAALAKFHTGAGPPSSNVLQDVITLGIGKGPGDGAKLCAGQDGGSAAGLGSSHNCFRRHAGSGNGLAHLYAYDATGHPHLSPTRYAPVRTSVVPGVFQEMVLAIEDAGRLGSFGGFRIAKKSPGLGHAGNLEQEENVGGVLWRAP